MSASFQVYWLLYFIVYLSPANLYLIIPVNLDQPPPPQMIQKNNKTNIFKNFFKCQNNTVERRSIQQVQNY